MALRFFEQPSNRSLLPERRDAYELLSLPIDRIDEAALFELLD
jgi:hypothetical protein